MSRFQTVIVSIKFSGTAASSDLVSYAILKTGMELKVRVVAFNFCPKLDIVAKKLNWNGCCDLCSGDKCNVISKLMQLALISGTSCFLPPTLFAPKSKPVFFKYSMPYFILCHWGFLELKDDLNALLKLLSKEYFLPHFWNATTWVVAACQTVWFKVYFTSHSLLKSHHWTLNI